MAQTMLLKDESPLLDTAISKLRPGVFSHPIWVRFGNREEPIPPKTIKALFIEAETIKQQSPSDACQVLLLCSVFQHYSGQTENALTTLHDVQTLANRNGLDSEILWALWGACAICVQKKRFEDAASYLTALMHFLSDHDDWVLAGFVDVVRQTLTHSAKTNNLVFTEQNGSRSLGNILTYTFQWLNLWGFAVQAQRYATQESENQGQPQHRTHPLLSSKGWHSLSLFFKGELKLHWWGDKIQHGKKRSTFWGYLLSLFRIEVVSQDQSNHPDVLDSETMPAETVPILPPDRTIPAVIQESKSIQEIPEPPMSISVQMLGNFNLTIQDTALNLTSSRSLSLLKYLLLNHRQNTPREMLLDIFWPEVSMERGRNNLNVALNGIRTSLRTVTDKPVIIYKDSAYGMSQGLQFWVDVEEFERLVQSGRRLEAQNRLTSAVSEYEAAVSLYQGDFLEENPYENWTVLPRERLRLTYLTTLDRLSHIYYDQERYAMCITFSQLILARDRCREDAHSMLMRCYSRQGQDHLALRQYQACVEALRLELDVTPTPETTKLYELIRLHKQV